MQAGWDEPGPRQAVWELTTRCDHACGHCLSSSARARPNELERDELLQVADALIEAGCERVTVIGGEAYLHPAMLAVVERLSKGGVRTQMQTGGRGFTPALARRCADAGMRHVGVSIDGTEQVHDLMRGSRGSWRSGIAALYAAGDAGMTISSNMQVNALNWRSIRATIDALKPTGIAAWRAQLTAPMGRAADRPAWILEPWHVLDVIDTLAAIQIELAEDARAKGLGPFRPSPRDILDIRLANNLGYYGPHEVTLRSQVGGTMRYYGGCKAGQGGIGIDSDGTVKACQALPSPTYAGADIREVSLAEIWQSEPLRFTRDRTTDELWGFCKTCMYADVCRAGCVSMAEATLGRRGNNPFCYHRADTLRKRGVRERLVHNPTNGAPDDPALFRIEEEPWPRA